MPEITIVIPVYNEDENIAVAIEKIEQEVVFSHVINIIYDTEQDTTIPVVLQEKSKYTTQINLLKNKYGKGVLNAIKTGLEASKTEFVIVTMADLSDPPSVINAMLTKAKEEDADIVCASRYMKGGNQKGGNPIKGFMSRMAGLTLNWFAGIPTYDSTNSFKLYRKSFLNQMEIESSGGFELGLELVVKGVLNGYKICEVPTSWTDRISGESNFKIIEWLPSYLKWYFMAFSKMKMEILISLISLLISIYVLLKWINLPILMLMVSGRLK